MNLNPKSTKLFKLDITGLKIGVENLYIKREDLNPSGSHKDRATWPMLDHYIGQGKKKFVISSSGNAAISAAYYMTGRNRLKQKNPSQNYAAAQNRRETGNQPILNVFISPNMPQDKRGRLNEILRSEKLMISQKLATAKKSGKVVLHESRRAKSAAIKFAKEHGCQQIRTSTDDLALGGYTKLADELIHELTTGLIQGSSGVDVFIPTSSGTTLYGISLAGYSNILENVGISLRLHAVQTSKCAVIAREFDQDFQPSSASLAPAIVDTIAHRKEKVIAAIKQSGGSGWVISDEELNRARELLEKDILIVSSASDQVPRSRGQKISWDSLLSLAGLVKAIKKGNKVANAVLLFTGK